MTRSGGVSKISTSIRRGSRPWAQRTCFHSINVTCANHEGDGLVTFQEWNGTKWNVVSDWIAPDWKLLRPIIEKAAAQYGAERTSRRAAVPQT